RRGGRVLAAAGARRDARVQRRGHGVASQSQLGRRLLEAAGGVRPGRSAARAKVARKIQRRGPPDVGGTAVRQGLDIAAWTSWTHLPRDLGTRPLPDADRPAARSAARSDADARGAARDAESWLAVTPRARLAAAARPSAHSRLGA